MYNDESNGALIAAPAVLLGAPFGAVAAIADDGFAAIRGVERIQELDVFTVASALCKFTNSLAMGPSQN